MNITHCIYKLQYRNYVINIIWKISILSLPGSVNENVEPDHGEYWFAEDCVVDNITVGEILLTLIIDIVDPLTPYESVTITSISAEPIVKYWCRNEPEPFEFVVNNVVVVLIKSSS